MIAPLLIMVFRHLFSLNQVNVVHWLSEAEITLDNKTTLEFPPQIHDWMRLFAEPEGLPEAWIRVSGLFPDHCATHDRQIRKSFWTAIRDCLSVLETLHPNFYQNIDTLRLPRPRLSRTP